MKRLGDLWGIGRGSGATTGRRALGSVIAALFAAAALALAGPAQASTPYPTTDECAASPAAVTPGATVTFACADGTFSPFESVLVVVEGDTGAAVGALVFAAPYTGTTISTATGAISVPITFPSAASGTYDIAAASATSAAEGTVSINRTADGADSPGLFSRGGWLLGAWVGGGLLVMAGGAIAVGTSVRRNRRDHESLTL